NTCRRDWRRRWEPEPQSPRRSADRKLHGAGGDGFAIGGGKGRARYFQVGGGGGAIGAIDNVADRGGGRTGGMGQARGQEQRDEAIKKPPGEAATRRGHRVMSV